jgi:crotonobetainyl-CoA:carnitine CoA-transferase CaiB-like acyl-CoA transferase
MNAALAPMTMPFSEYLIEGKLPQRHGNQNPSLSPAGTFKTADNKYITIAVLRESHWKKFCHGINRPDLEEDSRFFNNTKRLENRRILNEILEPIFLSGTSDDWVGKLREADILCAPLNNFKDIVEDVNFDSTVPLLDIPFTTETVKVMGTPILFNGEFFPAEIPSPKKGEHTVEILSEFGYSETKINCFIKNGSVFT